MATGRSTIPLHKLEETTTDGFVLKTLLHDHDLAQEEVIFLDAHRDDHYLFLLMEKGKSRGMVDFQVFNLKENSLLFILPGQVHKYSRFSKDTEGWFLAMDTGLVPDEFRAVLEDPLLTLRPINPEAPCMEQMKRCLRTTNLRRTDR